MNRKLLAVLLAAFVAGTAHAQVKEDIKEGAHDVKNGAVDAAHGVKEGAKGAWHATKRGAHHVAHKVKSVFHGTDDHPAHDGDPR